MKKLIDLIIFLLPLSFMLSIFFTRIDSPFSLLHEGNSYWFGSFARTHLVFGLKKTLGQDFYYNGPTKEPTPYLHHPPGLGLTIATVVKVLNFGSYEEIFLQERLVVIAFHLGTYFLIAYFSYRFFKSLLAVFLSLLMFVLTPLSLYYGRLVSHEVPTLFFVLFAFLFFLKLQEKQKKIFKLGLFFSIFFACFYGWPGFYFIPIIILISFLWLKKEKRNFFLDFLLWEVIFACLFFGQLYLAANHSWNFLESAFKERFNLAVYDPSLTNLSWLLVMIKNFLANFTPILAILSFSYLIYLISNFLIKKKSINDFQAFILFFYIFAFLHIILWRSGSYYHQFWQFYFLPAVILSATFVLIKIEKFLENLITFKFLQFPIKLSYFLFFFYFLIITAQPKIASLYTNNGKFPFPHFFISGF